MSQWRIWSWFSYLMVLLLPFFFSESALAQQAPYPVKPIHIVVPSAAGGASDLVARLIGDQLARAMKVPVVVENRPGAGNVIGTTHVAKSAADGYTFLLTYTDHVFNPYMFENLPFDAQKDFMPVAYVGSVPQVLVVNKNLPVDDVKALIALAKAKPGTLNFGSVGSGSSLHLAGELFKSMAGVDVVHVPYNGGPASTVGLISNQVQFLFPTLSSARKALDAGQIRALAVGSTTRAPQLPDVATVAEAGLPGYEAAIWYALLAPAGTPEAIVTRINKEVNTALVQPNVVATLTSQGFALHPGTPADLEQLMQRESKRWAEVIRNAHLKRK